MQFANNLIIFDRNKKMAPSISILVFKNQIPNQNGVRKG